MAEGLLGFESTLPGGLFTILVSDHIRDMLESGTFGISGQASDLLSLSDVISDYLQNHFWFVNKTWAYSGDSVTFGQVKALFPNTEGISGNGSHTIQGKTLYNAIEPGNFYCAVGLYQPPSGDFAPYYTLFGSGSIARARDTMGVGFIVLRESEIDFENKKLNIASDANAPVWVEIQWNRTSWHYNIIYAPSGSTVDLAHLLERMPELATIDYSSYVGSQDDPYSPGGNTEPGGGEGDFDNTSDPIPEASLPTLSAVDAKFISLYTPTLAELQSLASYMWSPLFDLDTLKKLFADPMKAILGLSIVPFTVPSSGQQAITIGNISTGVNMTKASAQYVQIDCGTLNVNEYWGAYLDYSPYTKLEIYLPYIGTKQISIDDVMNKACHVYYNIDILTGACCAMIKCDDSVLYSYSGQCATSIPITGNDWTNVVSGALSATLSSVGVIAGAVTGNAPATGMAGISLLSSASQNVMAMKPIIEKSGTIAGSAGMLGVQSPYLILTRPRQALPNNQNHFTGYPSYVNVKLGDLTGMTFVEQVHLENVPCTSSEQSEIETLLKGGVIF